MDTPLEVNVKYRKDDSELLSDKATKPLHLHLEHNKIDHSLFTILMPTRQVVYTLSFYDKLVHVPRKYTSFMKM